MSLKTVFLDSPQTSNALSAALVERLLAAVREAYKDGTQTLVFKGEGKNFCAGFDLSGLDEARDQDLFARFVRIEQLLQAVYMAPFDTVACAKGAAYGAGADLFSVCRYRIAEPGCRFAMPGLQFGVTLGTRRLAQLVGEEIAYELLSASVPFDTKRAMEIGFANALEPEARWDDLIHGRYDSRKIGADALSRLSRATRQDTCAQDMVALVESTCEPGLVERLRRYKAKLAANAAARSGSAEKS